MRPISKKARTAEKFASTARTSKKGAVMNDLTSRGSRRGATLGRVMGRRVASLAIACVIAASAEQALAGGTCATGTIDTIHAATPSGMSFGKYAVEVTLFRTATWGGPSCTGTGRWGLSIEDAGGRALYATLLTAQASGKTVALCGSGLCTVIGGNDAEDLAYVDIYP